MGVSGSDRAVSAPVSALISSTGVITDGRGLELSADVVRNILQHGGDFWVRTEDYLQILAPTEITACGSTYSITATPAPSSSQSIDLVFHIMPGGTASLSYLYVDLYSPEGKGMFHFGGKRAFSGWHSGPNRWQYDSSQSGGGRDNAWSILCARAGPQCSSLCPAGYSSHGTASTKRNS